MSIRSRIAGLASLIGANAVAAALSEKDQKRVLVVDDAVLPAETPKATTKPSRFDRWAAKRLERVRYYGSYKGGKHRRGVPMHIMQDYLDEAQAKRYRKNAKRAREFGYT